MKTIVYKIGYTFGLNNKDIEKVLKCTSTRIVDDPDQLDDLLDGYIDGHEKRFSDYMEIK